MDEKTFTSSLPSPTGKYSCTINPSDADQYFESRDTRVYTFLRNIYKTLVKLNLYCNYTFYLEISKGGRLHLHGILEPTDLIEFYLNVPPILAHYSQYELDTIDDLDTWNNYITKDQEVTNWDDYLSDTVFDYPIQNEGVSAYVSRYIKHRNKVVATVREAPEGLESYGVLETPTPIPDKPKRRRRRRPS